VTGISLDLTSNVSDVLKGAKKSEDALADVADSLDELGKAGGKNVNVLSDYFDQAAIDARRSGDKMESSFKDFASSTPRVVDAAAEKMERSFKELANETRDQTKKIADDTAKNYKRGAAEASTALDDLKSEGKQNAEELASSFDGSVESIRDGLQSVAATGFAGFGPAGIAAGLAPAAGIGLVGAAFDAQGERADQLAEDTNSAFERMIESGGRYLTTELENQAILEAVKDPKKWQQILDITKLTGLAQGDVTRAVALEGSERDKAIEKLNTIYDANNDLITSGEGFTDELVSQNGKLSELAENLKTFNSIQDGAVAKAQAYDAATGNAIKNRSDERDAIQDRNRALENTPNSVPVKLTVDDSALKAALVKKSIDVVFNAVTKFGKEIK
jgi:type II secretory pathway pseudopilin PulG